MQPARVTLLGFGTVGRSVARILTERQTGDLRLACIFNRDVDRKRVDWVPPDVRWTSAIDEALAVESDIVVELVGGLEPAGTWVRRALDSGRSVVTANKQLIANAGADLLRLASDRGAELRFEGSVAGGIPIICALRDGLSGDRISRVAGILNGTCNYILTSMEAEGAAFAAALAKAQELGYAEADPTDDVEGYDARAKLAILGAVALGADVRPVDIATRPITAVDALDFAYAQELGCTIRQVSQAEWSPEDDQRLIASVRPSLVPRGSALARVSGSQNVVVLRGHYGAETVFSGFGAGGGPTSVAVVSDLIALARRAPQRATVKCLRKAAAVDAEFVTPHYLRFVVNDRPGIIASIAGVMERHAINIDAVLQRPAPSKEALPFVVTIEACPPGVLGSALQEIGRMDFHVQPPVDLPVLVNGARG